MVRCDVCCGQVFHELLLINEPDRFERSVGIESTGYNRRWMTCENCGLAKNILPSASLQKLGVLRSAYYEVDFAGTDLGAKYRKVMALPAEQSDNAGRVARILGFSAAWHGDPGQRELTVLDVGAGTGVFLARFQQDTHTSWRYLALEPDPDAAGHLRALNLFPVFEARFEGQAELKNFDLITLNKVLEHIEDPLDFLGSVKAGLSPFAGLLYVEVPDELTAILRPPSDNILGALHCHLYDPASLSFLLQKAGFEVLRVDRILEPSGKITTYAFAVLQSAFEKKVTGDGK